MTTDDAPRLINTPGVYDIPIDAYIRDPVEGGSLSRSGAKKLLPPSCPAKYRYEIDHPPTETKEQALGQIAHRFVLGAGPEVVVVSGPSYAPDEWRTNEAKDAVKEVRESGGLPVRPKHYEQMGEMVAALRKHPLAARLLDPGNGDAEQALIWRDDDHGIWRRALLDLLPVATPGRMKIPDYKTITSADAESISRAIHSYRYHMQGVWYAEAVVALGLAEEAELVLVFQEIDPPYLVNVVEMDQPTLDVGRFLVRQAIEVYKDCRARDVWPGYGNGEVEIVGLPPWVERQFETEIGAADLAAHMAKAGG